MCFRRCATPLDARRNARSSLPADAAADRHEPVAKMGAFLEQAGFGAAHWSDVGVVSAPDSEIMAYAKANGWIILTHDLDFGAILAASGGDAPSVVQIRADNLSTDAIGSDVVAALNAMADALADGALVTVEPARARVSMLPIGNQL